jgi:hypothetical protein
MADEEPKKPLDVMYATGQKGEDGYTPCARIRDGHTEYGAFRPAESGAPMVPGNELVRMMKDPDVAPGWRVESIYRPTSAGPAQVATPAYRENWDSIFGKKPTIGKA